MPGRRAERFLTTVLFTDIVGSTQLAAELGDRGWRDLVHEHHRLVRVALRRHGGREVDTAGDSFFAVFDAPASAVECALEIVDAVHALGIEVRGGLHVGEVEQIAGKVGGIAVPIGARIMAAAGPGEVLVSSTVHDLAAGAGLRFEDRGVRELKGVPGEWRLYAVIGSAALDASGHHVTAVASEADPAARRATAVRRRQSRPIWQRRPRLAAGTVMALAVVTGLAGLLVWSPWRGAALADVTENAVGVIDPGRNEIVRQAAVGDQPSGIAWGDGAAWVANAGSDSVSRLDPKTYAVVDTIDVGRSPEGVAVGQGSVWVANGGEPNVTRINAASGRVVDTIGVGNGPRAIAFGGGAVWVTNSGDGTVTRIDAASGSASPAISVGSLPSALAVDDTGVWVVSEDGGTVTHLDARNGLALAPPIPVGTRPSAVVSGEGSIWVANAGDGSISRIDPATNRLIGVLDVGGTPVGLSIGGAVLWVSDREGAIRRLDLTRPTEPGVRIATTSAPQAIVTVGPEVWFATRASAASHRGGTLRVVSNFPPGLDPAAGPYYEFAALLGDGLVGPRRVGGLAGSQLLPNLALSLPKPTDGGRTYTFHLRPGIVYSDGTPVRPADVKFSIERTFQVGDPFGGTVGGTYYATVKGADACADGPVERCDLSDGIVVDDAAGAVTFHLTRPDPDFLNKLALPSAFLVPIGAVPANTAVEGPRPVTGPYLVVSVSADEVRLARNPLFRSWDPQVRPDGFADEIVWRSGIEPSLQVTLVESGEADYMADQIPPEAFPSLRTQYAPQLHPAATSTTYVFFNTARPPFDHHTVRQAVNLAIDRAKVVALRGGSIAGAPTCQVLPPNFRGYEPYCPYTKDPGPGGRWTAPDLDAARRLIDSSGTAGMKITVGPFVPRLTPIGAYVTEVLKDLGYDATQEVATDFEQVFQAIFVEKRAQIGAFEWLADYPDPDTFLGAFTCEGDDGQLNYCDPALDALVADARDLQAGDPAAAARKWAEIDRRVTDLALWAPLLNEGSDFVSARVGNYQFNTTYAVLLDQLWVQ